MQECFPHISHVQVEWVQPSPHAGTYCSSVPKVSGRPLVFYLSCPHPVPGTPGQDTSHLQAWASHIQAANLTGLTG